MIKFIVFILFIIDAYCISFIVICNIEPIVGLLIFVCNALYIGVIINYFEPKINIKNRKYYNINDNKIENKYPEIY